MLKKEIREDPVIVRFLSIMKTARQSINVETVTKEVQALHSTRKSRSLSSAKMSPMRLMDAIMMDQANRSRLIEIKTLVYRVSEMISTAFKATKRHIRITYELQSSTKAEREDELDNLFPSALSFKEDLTSLSDQIDLVVKDIDQMSYALTSVRELLKLVLDRKGIEI